jgi:hypothetical protein
MKALLLVLLLCALPPIALGQDDRGGFYKTEPGYGGAWKRMCITNLSKDRVEVFISAGYCPSRECLNYRPDNITFHASRRGNRVRYSSKDGCRFTISFGNQGAKVVQSASCRNDEHPYLYADGLYKFIESGVGEENCGGA